MPSQRIRQPHSSLRWVHYSDRVIGEFDLRQKTIIYLLTGLLGFIQCSLLFAQDLKLGFVDSARILKDAPQADAARKKLEEEFAPRDKKIVNMQTELKRLDEQQKRDDLVMTDETRKKIDREIVSLKRDIKRAKEEFTEDFNIRRNDELSKLQKLIYETTVKVAKDEGFDMILSDSVIYTSKRADITEKILERLRSLSKAETSDNPKTAQ